MGPGCTRDHSANRKEIAIKSTQQTKNTFFVYSTSRSLDTFDSSVSKQWEGSGVSLAANHSKAKKNKILFGIGFASIHPWYNCTTQ